MAAIIDSGARRPVIVYTGIAVVLFAALLGGVSWAKSRATYYSQHQTSNNQTASNTNGSNSQGNKSQQTPAPASNTQNNSNSSSASNPSTPSSSSSGSTAPATTPSTGPPVAATTPARVPSTGPEQFMLPIVSLSVFVFAVLSYTKARRRLQATVQ